MYRNSPHELRREVRNELMEQRQFHRVDVQFQRLQDLPRNQHLSEYFYTSGITVEQLNAQVPLQARITQFKDMTFVHTVVPEISVTWQRDHLSVDRAIVFIVRRGSLSFSTNRGVHSRGEHLHLISPSTEPISISVDREGAELVYLSIPVRLVQPIHGVPVNDSNRVALQALAPMYSFFTSLCSLSYRQLPGLEPLMSLSEEVIKTTIAVLRPAEQTANKSLVQQAVEMIVSEYANRDLTPGVLAERLNVSVRTLQMHFAREGSTITEVIRSVRASAAQRRLEEDPRITRKTLAEQTGFSSPDRLRRALQKLTVDMQIFNPLDPKPLESH